MKTNKNTCIDTVVSSEVTKQLKGRSYSGLVESLLRYWLNRPSHERKILESRLPDGKRSALVNNAVKEKMDRESPAKPERDAK